MLENLISHKAIAIARRCGIVRLPSFVFLFFYYLVTLVSATLDGVSLAMLLNLLTGKYQIAGDEVMRFAFAALKYLGFSTGFNSLLFLVISLACLRSALYFLLQVADGYLLAHLRRKIQNDAFTHVLNSSWEELRKIRVGQYVGAVTQETAIVIKYYISMVRAGYYLLSGITLGAVAVILSPQLTILLALAAIPILAVFHLLFTLQSRISARQTSERQAFTADVAERFSNLLQIKVDGRLPQHIETGLRHQNEVTRLEVRLGYCQALIGTLKIVLPIVGLLYFYAWTRWQQQSVADTLHIFASVGVLGLRTAQQFDNLLSMFGNLSLVSGSLEPVYSIFAMRTEKPREPVTEPIVALKAVNASYSYRKDTEIKAATFSAEFGAPFFIRGPSGAGKTTLANMLTGLINPHGGRIVFIGRSGNEYDARNFWVRSGYVTQDIQLFHGSVRQNLVSFSQNGLSDEVLWRHLKLSGAEDFVRNIGGLDAVIAEGGRSLSGGERRRLGIARALAGEPQILILDEVTSGLDPDRKAEILHAIELLSKSYLTLVITHDPPGPAETNLRTLLIGERASQTKTSGNGRLLPA